MKIHKIVFPSGNIRYRNDKNLLHREDGPAAIYPSCYKAWYINGKLHRTDGPAIEWLNGHRSWYINGEQLTEEEFKRRITKLYKML